MTTKAEVLKLYNTTDGVHSWSLLSMTR
ncbi:hypothetical protein A2U01_0093080, partial [Trifolium medium]|nr:hypothetical protein [Trifolium medium]